MARVQASISLRYNLRSRGLDNLVHPSIQQVPVDVTNDKKKKKQQKQQKEQKKQKKRLVRKQKRLAKLGNVEHESKDIMAAPRPFLTHATGPDITIPFIVEHKVKGHLQELLEQAMFKFCQDWAPDVLKRNNWLSPEMTELSLFARDLVRINSAKKGLNPSMELGWAQFIDTLKRLNQLRHSAVHRIVVGEQGLDHIASDAVILLEAVQDAKRHAKVSIIRAKISARDWGKILEALETPLSSVPVLPFYGRKVDAIDLTKDDPEHTVNGEQQQMLKSRVVDKLRYTASGSRKDTDGVGGVVEHSDKGKRKREIIDLTEDDAEEDMSGPVKRLTLGPHSDHTRMMRKISVRERKLARLPDEGYSAAYDSEAQTSLILGGSAAPVICASAHGARLPHEGQIPSKSRHFASAHGSARSVTAMESRDRGANAVTVIDDPIDFADGPFAKRLKLLPRGSQ